MTDGDTCIVCTSFLFSFSPFSSKDFGSSVIRKKRFIHRVRLSCILESIVQIAFIFGFHFCRDGKCDKLVLNYRILDSTVEVRLVERSACFEQSWNHNWRWKPTSDHLQSLIDKMSTPHRMRSVAHETVGVIRKMLMKNLCRS